MNQAEQWELEDLLGKQEEEDETPKWKKVSLTHSRFLSHLCHKRGDSWTNDFIVRFILDFLKTRTFGARIKFFHNNIGETK